VVEPDTIKTHSLKSAIDISYSIEEDTIHVILSPGAYILNDIIEIKQSNRNKANSTLFIRSSVNPDQEQWSNKQMPVILSSCPNNDMTGFPHSVGFKIQRNNVMFSGIKFLGNTNPEVLWYYPISRKDSLLMNLTVKQCIFIGNENSLPIQAGTYCFGSHVNIENNVFNGCRNASLFFNKAEYSSFNNNIVLKADESVVWIGRLNGQFTMTNNLISDSNFGIIKSPIDSNLYPIRNNIFNAVDTLIITYEYLIDSTYNENYFETNKFELDVIKRGRAHPYWDRDNLHFSFIDPSNKIGIFTK